MPKTLAKADPTLIVSTEEIEHIAQTLPTEPPSPPAKAKSRSSGPILPAPYLDRGEIARGGMGAVRAAFDNDLQRMVAIKSMLPGLSKKENLARRFIDEARITALVDHPNIAPVHRLARGGDGELSLVMKLIEGRTFSSYLAELPEPPWPVGVLDSVLSVFVKVCDAMAFAHSRGVLHLDLKPDNVMLGAFGQVYVVDWGIARYQPGSEQPALLKPLAPKQASTGTPTYMSPEQARHEEKQISELTDVFLLGGMLYEILTGKKPHPGTTVRTVIKAAAKGEVKHPSKRTPNRHVPPALAAIAMKALSQNPEDRYQSVLKLQRDVVAFQRGEDRAPRRSYAPGAEIIREGESGNEAFVIVSGRCVVTAMTKGKRVVLRELGPGEVFGETAVFSEEARSATVEALDKVVVRVITGETLSQTLGLQTWAGHFVKALAERFREADQRSRQMAGRP